MTIRWMTAAGAALIAAGGCASNNGRETARENAGPAAGLNQSRMLLASARETQAEQGCAKAVPTYRIVASFGEGYDVAQYELGACLLEMASNGGPEAGLFRDEGLLWVKRAAWAGAARAQHRLAGLLSGAGYDQGTGVAPDPQAAMGWALVYQVNPARSLYALPEVPEPVLDHLRAELSESALADAAAFAEDFEQIDLAAFTPPAPPRNADAARRQMMQGRNRPPRRLTDTEVASL